MIRIAGLIAISFLTTHSTSAAPSDYRDKLPGSIKDMRLVQSEMIDGQLVAYYGETIGRATLRITPAPEADARGARSRDDAPTGETPAAQRALLLLLARNLEEGAGPLGAGYSTAPVRLSQIELDGSGELNGTILNCGVIERLQAEEAKGDSDEPMGLVDNVCVSQHGDEVISVSITTPHYGNKARQNFSQAQITFSGLLIGELIRK